MTARSAVAAPVAALQAARPVLEVSNYSLHYATPAGDVTALEGVSLTVAGGRTLGLVGESGSGKTSLAWAILRYLPANAREGAGRLLLSGEDLRAKSPGELLALRGRRIGMVFQDPGTSLNPTLMLGDQLTEVLVRHRGLTLKDAREKGEALLARTGISRPAEMLRRYPHEASGGEKQRVVIATAFACEPECIIFDEPTTALDVITARQIQDLFARLQEETRVAALYISHDLALVARIAHEVAVIHRGRIVEQGPAARVLAASREEYTKRLIAAVPQPRRRLVRGAPAPEALPLLAAERLTVCYGESGILDRLLGRARQQVTGAHDVDLVLRPGEILGIVGESGSGKSTIARALAGLVPFEGTVRLAERCFGSGAPFDRAYRRAVQIVFQNPDGSLNPRQRVRDILARPLILYGLARRSELDARIGALLESVLLPRDFAGRYPHQLSGGEKQRVAIARAFAAQPRVVLCDEVTSSLDVSVQAQVVRLLVDLQARTGCAVLFISHDINLVRQIAHRIAVMQGGECVDLFDVVEAHAPGRHPYTRRLLDAVTTLPAAAGEPGP